MNCTLAQQELSVALLTRSSPDTATASHVAGCPQCAAEQARLHAMPALMATVTGNDLEPPSEPQNDLFLKRLLNVAQLEATARRQRKRRFALAGAAVVLMVLSAAATLAVIRTAQNPQTLQASASSNGINATATVTAHEQGSNVSLWIEGVPEDTHCILRVLSKGNDPQVIADWTAEYESSITFAATSPASPDAITRIQVVQADGPTLLDIPVTS